ncbi:MAG: lamin tail domain-containing protein [Paludibacteraceae bacterium]|nr:lamin tail domain-containing protein [Paludibacteraceae bacterium]
MKNYLFGIGLLAMPLYGQTDRFVRMGDTLWLDAPAEAAVSEWNEASEVSHNAFWQITVRMEFATSSSNYARWYLLADQDSLQQAANACFVRIGQSSHQVELCCQEDGKVHKLLTSGPDVLAAGQPLTIQVARVGDLWRLSLPAMGWADSTVHTSVCGSRTWGVVCTYTKTRSKAFFFYDFRKEGNPCVPLPDPAYRDVRITEWMSCPPPDGADYVEIHNLSEQDYALQGLSLSNGRSTKSLPADTLYAGSYRVLTRDSDWVAGWFERCDASVVRTMADLPALTAAAGKVTLLNRYGEVVDSVSYHQELLGTLVADPCGIAYELDENDGESIGPASCDGGCGSPGMPNAFRVPVGSTSETELNGITLSHDVLRAGGTLQIRFAFSGSVLAQAAIYDLGGSLRYSIYGNELITGPVTTEWQGVDAQGRPLQPGIYILFCETVTETGKVTRKKIPFVLAPVR